MSGKPSRIVPFKSKNENATITYIKNGKEKTININKHNEKSTYVKIARYINSNSITSIHFKNYDLTDKYSFQKIVDKDIDITLENCFIQNLYCKRLKNLTIINPVLVDNINIQIDGVVNVNIELENYYNNINLNISYCNKLDIKSLKSQKNIKLHLERINDVYLENLRLEYEILSINWIKKLFLNNCSLKLNNRNYNYNIECLLSLNNSSISSNTNIKFSSIYQPTLILQNNSKIISEEVVIISNPKNIIFADELDNSILDTSSYIEAKEIGIGNFYLGNFYLTDNDSNEKIIFDENKLKELLPQVIYIKDNKEYQYQLPYDIEEGNDIFYINGYKLTLKDDIDFIYIKNYNFSDNEIILNENQFIVLEDCYLSAELFGGNIEIISKSPYLNQSYNLYTISKAKDVIINLEKSSSHHNIEVNNTKNVTLKSNGNLDGLVLDNIEKVHLLNLNLDDEFDYIENCNELIIENSNLNLSSVSCEIIDVKKITLLNSILNDKGKCNFQIDNCETLNLNNSKIISNNDIIISHLKTIITNKSSINSSQIIYFPILEKIITNNNLENISYFNVGKYLKIGNKKIENFSKINITTELINTNRILLLKLLSNLKEKLTNQINSTINDEEQKQLKELEEEFNQRKKDIKNKYLTKKEEQLNKNIKDLN